MYVQYIMNRAFKFNPHTNQQLQKTQKINKPLIEGASLLAEEGPEKRRVNVVDHRWFLMRRVYGKRVLSFRAQLTDEWASLGCGSNAFILFNKPIIARELRNLTHYISCATKTIGVISFGLWRQKWYFVYQTPKKMKEKELIIQDWKKKQFFRLSDQKHRKE